LILKNKNLYRQNTKGAKNNENLNCGKSNGIGLIFLGVLGDSAVKWVL